MRFTLSPRALNSDVADLKGVHISDLIISVVTSHPCSSHKSSQVKRTRVVSQVIEHYFFSKSSQVKSLHIFFLLIFCVATFTLWGGGTVCLPDRPLWWQTDLPPPPPPPPGATTAHTQNKWLLCFHEVFFFFFLLFRCTSTTIWNLIWNLTKW